MNTSAKFSNIRDYPEYRSLKVDIIMSLLVVVLGAMLGFVSKATDSISFIGELGTELGVWIFVATLVSAYSRYPYSAAINTMLFFLAMLFSYYLYGYLVLGFFPKSYFMGWLVMALLSPLAGFVVWFSKGKRYMGVVASALPISILFALGYPFFYTYKPVLFFSLCFGIVLNVLLPETWHQKIGTFLLSILLAFAINVFHILDLLPI